MANRLFDELTIQAKAHGFTAEVDRNQLLLRVDDDRWAACVTPDGALLRVRDFLQGTEKADQLMDIMRPEVTLVREYVSRMEDGPVIRAGGETWHELAEYGGVVLAGRYSDHGGCRFVTWRRGRDGGMNLGHYFETDYAAAKADFAVRSGLVAEPILTRSPVLDRLCDRLNRLVDNIAHEAQSIGPGRPADIDVEELQTEFGIEAMSSAPLFMTVHNMLTERADMAGIDFEWHGSHLLCLPMEPEFDPGPTLSM